jgi:hypothetical protein
MRRGRALRFGGPSLLLLVGVVALLALPVLPAATGTSPGARPAPGTEGSARPHPASTNPPCYALSPTICVSMTNTSSPSIIPTPGSFTAPTEPPAGQSIVLVVKSRVQLNYPYAPTSGPGALLQLNVTGTLWNGDPYYSVYSQNVWHANNATTDWWCAAGSGCGASNASYPWWYYVEFASTAGPGGAANFAPGMHVQWWIAFDTMNGTSTQAWVSPVFSFTFEGAWPFSPFAGASQYAGPSAWQHDVAAALSPLAPNWNDPVSATLTSLPADGAPVNATIGAAYWVVWERDPNGSLLDSTTLTFPVAAPPGGSSGNGTSTSLTLPPRWAQVSGARVSYYFVIYDAAGDALLTPNASFVVGGNGSFGTGIFADDLNLSIPALDHPNASAPYLPIGTSLAITLTSRATNASILQALVHLTFTDGAIGESVNTTIALHRVFSTRFEGAVPPLPVGATATITLEAWDFRGRAESSSAITYRAPTLGEALPQVPGNATFFFVYVFDNGSHTWVSNATVSIAGASRLLHLTTRTVYGIAYPNVSGAALVPVVLPTNATYQIAVTDPAWVSPEAPANGTAAVTILVGGPSGPAGPIAVGRDYTVLRSGNAIEFFLNATLATPPPSPVAPLGWVELPAIVGLVGGLFAVLPLLVWWRRLEERRASERKRVTQ